MKKKKLFFVLAIGAAIGAVLGLLFAPKKGTDTRRDLSDKGKGWLQTLKEKMGQI